MPPISKCSTPSRRSRTASTPTKALSTSCIILPIVGLFIAGGGKSGVLRGLREDVSGFAKSLNVVGLDLTPEARSGLLDGVIDIILSHQIKLLEETTVDLLASVSAGETNGEPVQRLLPFDIYTPENL